MLRWLKRPDWPEVGTDHNTVFCCVNQFDLTDSVRVSYLDVAQGRPSELDSRDWQLSPDSAHLPLDD